MSKDVSRDFAMPEAEALEIANQMLSNLDDNITDFTASYTEFDLPFRTNMQDAIDICEATSTDQICLAKQHIQTVKVEVEMGSGRRRYQGMEEYIKLGFPGNAAMLKLYGQPLYDKARSSHLKLPVLLMQAYDLASDTTYKPLIIAKGATQLQIDALKANALSINAAVKLQGKLMGARNLTTQDRTINLNILWAMMVKISDCAKIIYVDNPAKQKLFLLYPDAPSAPPTPPTPLPTV